MGALVTIIMPVYNTEKFLDKAIESIINQTFENFDFIIIDNGSTDKSGDIINRWAKKDRRIKVIHNRENQLISDARNRAIELSDSKYICFADSDDWIENEMLADMVEEAEKSDADLVIAGFYMEYYQQGKYSCYPVVSDQRNYSKDEFKKEAYKLLNKTMLAVPWNKLFKLENIRKYNIKYRNTKWEDHHFNMDYIMDCGNVSVIGKAYYHYYRSRPGSDSEIVYDRELYKKRKEHFMHTLEVYKHWGYWDSNTEKYLANYYSGRMLQCTQEASCFKGLSVKERKNKIRDILNDDLTVEQIEKAKPDNLMMAICLLPLKWRNVSLCYIEGVLISFVKTYFSNLFYQIRAKEAQGANRR